jgi:hypothetical protein
VQHAEQRGRCPEARASGGGAEATGTAVQAARGGGDRGAVLAVCGDGELQVFVDIPDESE